MCKCVFYHACMIVYLWPPLSWSWQEYCAMKRRLFCFLFLQIQSCEIALWLIAVVCDLYSRCNSPTPQGLHTSAIVTVTYWSPSPWQHHQGGSSPQSLFLLPAEGIWILLALCLDGFFFFFCATFPSHQGCNICKTCKRLFLSEYWTHLLSLNNFWITFSLFIWPSHGITGDYCRTPLIRSCDQVTLYKRSQLSQHPPYTLEWCLVERENLSHEWERWSVWTSLS